MHTNSGVIGGRIEIVAAEVGADEALRERDIAELMGWLMPGIEIASKFGLIRDIITLRVSDLDYYVIRNSVKLALERNPPKYLIDPPNGGVLFLGAEFLPA